MRMILIARVIVSCEGGDCEGQPGHEPASMIRGKAQFTFADKTINFSDLQGVSCKSGIVGKKYYKSEINFIA